MCPKKARRCIDWLIPNISLLAESNSTRTVSGTVWMKSWNKQDSLWKYKHILIGVCVLVCRTHLSVLNNFIAWELIIHNKSLKCRQKSPFISWKCKWISQFQTTDDLNQFRASRAIWLMYVYCVIDSCRELLAPGRVFHDFSNSLFSNHNETRFYYAFLAEFLWCRRKKPATCNLLNQSGNNWGMTENRQHQWKLQISSYWSWR